MVGLTCPFLNPKPHPSQPLAPSQFCLDRAADEPGAVFLFLKDGADPPECPCRKPCDHVLNEAKNFCHGDDLADISY